MSASDIAEATRSVDTVVVQTWLSARGQARRPLSSGTRWLNKLGHERVYAFAMAAAASRNPRRSRTIGADGMRPVWLLPDEWLSEWLFRVQRILVVSAVHQRLSVPIPILAFYGPGVLGFGLARDSARSPRPSCSRRVARTTRGHQGCQRMDIKAVGRPWGARPGGVNPAWHAATGGPRPGGPRPGGARPGSPTPPPTSQMPGGQRASGQTSISRAPVSYAPRGGMSGRP